MPSNSEDKCQTPGCLNTASLQCPKCLQLGLPPAKFCSQTCFKSSWNLHKSVHNKEEDASGLPSIFEMDLNSLVQLDLEKFLQREKFLIIFLSLIMHSQVIQSVKEFQKILLKFRFLIRNKLKE